MPVISSIILIARIVAAVGGGGLILAWRLRTQHFNHFPVARCLRLRRNSNSVCEICDTLRMQGTAIRAACLSLLLKAAQHLLKRSSLRLPSSHMLCLLCQKGRSPPRLP